MITRFCDVHKDWLDTSDIPEIHLKGAYLEKMGFSIGTGVMVVVEKGRIVITPLDWEAGLIMRSRRFYYDYRGLYGEYGSFIYHFRFILSFIRCFGGRGF